MTLIGWCLAVLVLLGTILTLAILAWFGWFAWIVTREPKRPKKVLVTCPTCGWSKNPEGFKTCSACRAPIRPMGESISAP